MRVGVVATRPPPYLVVASPTDPSPADPAGEAEHDRHLRQLAAHGWAYRRLLRRGVLALWALAAVEFGRLLLELAR